MASASELDHSRRRPNRWGEGELLRVEIVQAARRRLEADGTEATMSLRGVAREAGITAPSIYGHFKDRDHLIEAVIAAVYADYLGGVQQALADLPEAASPRDRMRAGVGAFIDFAHRFPASAQILWARPNPTQVPTVQMAAIEDHDQLLAGIAAAAPSLTPAEVARRGQLLWAGIYGLAILPPHHPRFPWSPQQDLIEDLLNSVLRA